MSTTETLLKQIEAHCAQHGIAESTFGKRAVNDGKLVSRLREGKSITLNTYQQILAALRSTEIAA